MTSSATDVAHDIDGAETEGVVDDAPAISDFLRDDRVVIDLDVSSRKRLFEQMAKLVSSADDGPGLDTILRTLTDRERLGCTGIGNGIALPHGRIENLVEPVIAIARLKHAIDYDAPDGVPVWFAVCLMVPSEAHQTHLELLAILATRFSTPGFIDQLKQSRTAAELSAHFR